MARFERNQSTPLLRLPAELRATIWDYALGGQVFKLMEQPSAASEWDAKLVPSNAEPTKSMALLRTCRQIYSETVSIPLGHGVLEYGDPWHFLSCKNALWAYQRGYVQRIRISMPIPDDQKWWNPQEWPPMTGFNDLLHWRLLIITLGEFPRVREVELLFHDVVDAGGDIFQNQVKDFQEWIKKNFDWLAFKVRGTSEKLGSFEIESVTP